ncbi:ABC transporter ATP-binding protein [Frisingicoccus sp.]|uniref:ABC transporter ATP-binding protein n=1 Tax=Frisingicoccus sp. TaxID=1918627 RepID=UPI003AB6D473
MRLEVRNLRKNFGEKEVLHGISFSIESGKALGLLGRNGAGKTTTIRILMDVFKANAGTITMDGKPFRPKDYQIGYLPEERGLYPKKGVQEQILYLAALRGLDLKTAKKQASYWLERMGVAEYAAKKLETLSKGNQQKVQLAQTLVCQPDIIILDEPFSGLDPVNSQVLKDVIREQIQDGKLVIFSSHQMGYVEEFCEDIVLINHGDVVLEGNLKDIKKAYGKNRLVISFEEMPEDSTIRQMQQKLGDLVHFTGKRQQEIIVELKEGTGRKQLLEKMLAENLVPESFGNYEPSLTEIFVERAGDQA